MKSLQSYEQFKYVKQNPLINSKIQLQPKDRIKHLNSKFSNSPSFYTIKTDLISPNIGVSFGSGFKVDFFKLGTKTPGPGHCQVQQSRTTQVTNLKTHIIGVIVKYLQRDFIEQPKVQFRLIRLHISDQNYCQNETCSPESGKYDFQVKEHSKSFVAGCGSRRSGQTIEDTPGPLEYRPRTEMSQKYANFNWSNCQVTKFSKVQRFGSNLTITPGHGKYQIAGEFGIY